MESDSFSFYSVPVILTAGLGSVISQGGINSQWYLNLKKPSNMPKNETFGKVWTFLYLLIFMVSYSAEKKAIEKKMDLSNLRKSFLIQISLNFIWISAFFGLQKIQLGFGIILLLIVSILWQMYEFSKIDEIYVIFYLPYLIWVFLASQLNFEFSKLN